MIELNVRSPEFRLAICFALAMAWAQLACAGEAKPERPNVIIIYLDDLGIGDVSAYGMGTLETPNIDDLARNGLKFTQGYATSATCTPSRYSLLTGDYPWRRGAAILPGDAPLLIDPQQLTLPGLLQKTGYTTAVIGKWHLGLGRGELDWNQYIALNPNATGFDYSFIMAATNDRVPNVYVRNGYVVNLEPGDPLLVSYQRNFPGEPTGIDNPELLTTMTFSNGHYHSINNGVSRIGYQKGGKSAQWIDEDMSDLFLEETLRFVSENKGAPFFLFYALHQPHVPRIPHARFAGKSGQGPRGDVILEADWAVGQLVNRLKELDLMNRTLLIFSSDNGPVLDDGYNDRSVTDLGDHTPWGIYRGGKYSLFDAGAHVPLIVRWDGRVGAGQTSDALFSQLDLLASIGALVNQDVTGLDSENHVQVLLGQSVQGRRGHVVQAERGRTAFRSGDWIYIPPYWGPTRLEKEGVETGACSCYQLYNIADDPGQKNNLAEDMPEKTAELRAAYEKTMASHSRLPGRTG
jgi:arylsulfatase A-like enzyme